MKTTKADFKKFKMYTLEWQSKLGLVAWALYFNHEDTKGCYASTTWSTNDMAATIRLCTDWDEFRPLNDGELKKLALHEVLHVLMAPRCSEASYRFATQDAIESAEHAIVRTLEALL